MSPHLPQWPGTIREINDLTLSEKHAIYRTLVPDWVFPRFGINPDTYSANGTRLIHFRCPTGSNSVELSVYSEVGAIDPVLYLHMGDTFNGQLVVLLVVVNDPDSPRFNIDVDEEGNPTRLGTQGRNIPEEIRAMEAGLGPGQIRRGLRSFRTAVPVFESFVGKMGHDLFFIEPLFYHNAITFERYGFAYSSGLRLMRSIHQGFLPDGELHSRLNGDTPFRQPEAWKTILGRSWAIHDGVLNQAFTSVKMYKHVSRDAGICTFPDAEW
jgi:hypothetical protein